MFLNFFIFEKKAMYSQNTPLHLWAESDRPREKLREKGRQALTDAELLAILLGSGTASLSAVSLAQQILGSVAQDLHQLSKLQLRDLMTFKGIGEAKAITILAALELGRRRKESPHTESPKITHSKDAFQVIQPYLMDIPHEEFWIILLNRGNRVIKSIQISRGGVAGTVADPKIIFKMALDQLASSLILVHNHPSGNLVPSQADIQLTHKMLEAGKWLDLPVLDHLIVHDFQYFSFADEGQLR